MLVKNVLDVSNTAPLRREISKYIHKIPAVSYSGKTYDGVNKATLLKYAGNKVGITLSNEQLIFSIIEPHSLLCEAIPGSGKTTSVNFKILSWKMFNCIKGNDILYLTYNKHASEDFSSRQSELASIFIGTSTANIKGETIDYNVAAKTFHRFAMDWVQTYPEEAGMKPFVYVSKVLMESYDLQELYKKAFKGLKTELLKKDNIDLEYTLDEYKLSQLVFLEAYAMENLLSIDDLYASGRMDDLKLSEEYYIRLIDKVRMFKGFKNSYTHTDFLTMLDTITEDEEICARMGRAFPYLIVDEYQDMTPLMRNVLRKLNKHVKRFVAIGDGDQAIYDFRGTDHRNVLKFEQEYADPLITKLTINRRCPEHVTRIANKITDDIEERIEKNNESTHNRGVSETVAYNGVKDMTDDIIKKIKDMSFESRDSTVIAYRNKRISLFLALRLIDEKIPFYLGSAHPPFKGHFNLAMYNLIKFIVEPANFRLLETVLYQFTSISKGDMTALAQSIRANSVDDLNLVEFGIPIWKVPEVIEIFKYDSKFKADIMVIRDLHYRTVKQGEDMVEIAMEMKSLVFNNFYSFVKEQLNYPDELDDLVLEKYKRPESIYKVRDNISQMLMDADKFTKSTQGVYLTTFHGLKGLEFENVFLTEVAEGILPSSNIFKEVDRTSLENDKRLLYVAITRTKANLGIYYPKGKPSRFLNYMRDIPNRSLVSEDVLALQGSILDTTQTKTSEFGIKIDMKRKSGHNSLDLLSREMS